MSLETKVCITCGKELPATLDYFGRRGKNSNTLRGSCKECMRERKKKWREGNEDHKRKKKEYNDKHQEQTRETRKKYRETHRAQILQYQREYRKNNPERNNSYKKNPEYYKAYARKHYAENRDYYREYFKKRNGSNGRIKTGTKYNQKEWREKNPEKIIMYKEKRRSKEKGLPSTLTNQQWIYIKDYFKNKCAYCGEKLPLQQEHFIPLSKGGEYTHNNIIPACKSCNCKKHTSDFFEWYPSQPFYSKAREKRLLKFLGYNDCNIQQPSLMI